MVASDSSEKRKHYRVGFETSIHIEGELKKIQFNGSSKDLSIRGVFAKTDNKLPLGAKCLVMVYLTGAIEKIELEMEGTVVRVDDNGMGIEFGSMDVDTYSHLKKIVQYNSGNDSV